VPATHGSRDGVAFPHLIVPAFLGRARVGSRGRAAVHLDTFIFVMQKNACHDDPRRKPFTRSVRLAGVLELLKLLDELSRCLSRARSTLDERLR
jgi:hypothetical protein